MAGTGTQADPFVVDTVMDLRSKMTVSGAYIKLACDLNCDDEMEYWTGIDTYFTEIDLNNHTIKNINISSTGNNYLIYSKYLNHDITIKNGTLQSIIASNLKYLIRTNSEGYGNAYIYLKNVKMSGILTMSGDDYLFASSGEYITKSSMNFRVTNIASGRSLFQSYNSRFSDCNIRIDYNTLGTINCTLINSKLVGTYHCTNSNTSVTKSLIYSATNSIIAVSMSTDGCKIKIADYANGVNIADNDLISATLDSTPANINLLTTQQCKSDTYLNSIGFTVLEE